MGIVGKKKGNVVKKFPIPKVVKKMAEQEAAKHRVLEKDDQLKAERSKLMREGGVVTVKPGAMMKLDNLEPGTIIFTEPTESLSPARVEGLAALLPAAKLGDLFIKRVSSVLGTEKVDPPVLIETFDAVKQFEDGWESLGEMARDRVKQTAKELGRQKLDDSGKPTTTILLEAGEWEQELRSRGQPVDEKKLEALIRSKGKDPNLFMQQVVIFKVDQHKLAWAVENKLLTQAEVDACKKPLEYNVMRPKRKGA
jgi:hypothetical protein